MESTNVSLECPEHSDRAIMRCITCNLQPLCQQCIGDKSTHIGHKYCHLSESSEDTTTILQQFLSKANDVPITKMLSEANDRVKENCTHYDTQLSKIRTRGAEFSFVLKDVLKELEKECETNRKSDSDVLQRHLDNLQKLQSELTRTMWQCRDVLQSKNESLMIKLQSKLQKLIEDCSISPPSVTPWAISLDGSIKKDVLTELFLSAELTTKPGTQPPHVESRKHANPPAQVESKNKENEPSQVQPEGNSQGNGNARAEETVRTSDFVDFLNPQEEDQDEINLVLDKRRNMYTFEGCGGAIENILPVENEEFWILFRGSNSLLRITRSGEIKRQVRIGKHYTYINDICCTPDLSSLYMCLGVDHSIRIMEVDGKTRTLFHTEGEPVCFALTKGNDLVISTQDGSPYAGFFREVALFSTSGHSMNTFGKKRDRRDLFGFPSRIKVNRRTGDIAIINSLSVTVVSRHFKLKYRYTEAYYGNKRDSDDDDSDSEGGARFSPKDVCFDSKSNLLIADCANNSVKVLDDTGRLQQVMRLPYRPESIGVSLKDDIVVGYDCGKMQFIKYSSYL